VNRLVAQSRRARASTEASAAFRAAFGEWAGHKHHAGQATGGDPEVTLPGLHAAAAAGHSACCRSLLRLSGDGSACGLGPGCRVQLQSLKAKPQLNGTSGGVVGFNGSTGRYSVQVRSRTTQSEPPLENDFCCAICL
jgi:hypothetical protein